MTWGMGTAPEPRAASGGTGGAWGAAGAGGAAAYCGLPHRTHLGAEAGFMLPQAGQRMYRTVPCSFASAVMVYARLG